MKVRARNAFGFGHYSEVNILGDRIQVEPHRVTKPVLDIVVSSLTQIKLDWVALTDFETGGSPIDSYKLEWDSGTNAATWSILKGDSGSFDTSLTYTLTDLTGSNLYKFRILAHNVHGWSSQYSEVVTF